MLKLSPSSRSTVDPAVSKPPSSLLPNDSGQTKEAHKPHPPRLQHSPSLPNIWFSSCNTAPMSPSSPKNSVEADPEPVRHVRYASISSPPSRDTSKKTHARRRTETNQGLALLTPPLTPSSSIRTSASINSTRCISEALAGSDASTYAEEILCKYDGATRFLVLEHVFKGVKYDDLSAAINEAAIASVPMTRPKKLFLVNPVERFLQNSLQRLIETRGIGIFFFADIRHAITANEAVLSSNQATVHRFVDPSREHRTLTSRLADGSEVLELLRTPPWLATATGSFHISVSKVPRPTQEGLVSPAVSQSNVSDDEEDDSMYRREGINISTLQNILVSHGELRSFTFSRMEVTHDHRTTLIYLVEYFDVTEGYGAFKDLKNVTMFGLSIATSGSEFARLEDGQTRVLIPYVWNKPPSARKSQAGADSDQLTDALAQLTLGDSSIPSPPYFYNSTPADSQVPGARNPTFSSQGEMYENQQTNSDPTWEGESTYRPHGGTVLCDKPDCAYCPSSRTNNSSSNAPVPSAQYTTYTYCTPSPGYYPASPPLMQAGVHPQYAYPPVPVMSYDLDPHIVPPVGTWVTYDHGNNYAFAPPQHYHAPPDARVNPHAPMFPYVPEAGGSAQMQCQPTGVYDPSFTVPNPGLIPSTHGSPPQILAPSSTVASAPTFVPSTPPDDIMGRLPSAQGVPERNLVNLQTVRNGEDTRTTIMIKNIPNKMSDQDLLTYIYQVCPRRIDFMYLRMDFTNGCNVGYAFVNFIDVKDLLLFAEKRLGKKWNMFSSEKVLQMSYATYQGKEALVEKFKNSCIMDERESWRPKIFYSSGPYEGLPEPFPGPSHQRRKERSSHNRGAFFGVGGVPRPNRLHNASSGRRHGGEEENRLHHHHPSHHNHHHPTHRSKFLERQLPSPQNQ